MHSADAAIYILLEHRMNTYKRIKGEKWELNSEEIQDLTIQARYRAKPQIRVLSNIEKNSAGLGILIRTQRSEWISAVQIPLSRILL